MSPQSNRQHLNSDDCRKTVIYMPFCAALWCVQYFDCSQLELPRVLQYSSNYSSSFFYYLSTRNFLFPVIISTSGGRSQSLSAIVNSCEVHIASGHFCCSLADCRLPRCNHCQLASQHVGSTVNGCQLGSTSISFTYCIFLTT